jgi:signal transduction histidine kinase
MISPPIPANEFERLSELYRYSILDTPEEEEYNEIVQLAAFIADCPISTITLIDSNRQWIKAKFGTDVSETEREVAFCAHCILQNQPLIIEDTTTDKRFFEHPFVTAENGIKFYAGFPLMTPAGLNLGSLCVVDIKPVKLNESQVRALKTLSSQVVKQMELRLKNEELKRMTEINNTIISVISHDYRSPLASITSLLKLIEDSETKPEDIKEWVPQVKELTERALDLSSDLIRWASARIKNRSILKEKFSVNKIIQSVISADEPLFVSKRNSIVINAADNLFLFCDKESLKIILRNLITNSNKFTSKGIIKISAEKEGSFIHFSIADTGIGMSKEKLSKLLRFNSPSSAIGTAGERGSGIGLILCKDLIESMGGKVAIDSIEHKGTTVKFTIPCPNF